MNANQSLLKKQLLAITNNQSNSISAAIAQEALDYYSITAFFSDLLRYGCQSGMVISLIYYSDTDEFYDTHYHEVEECRYDFEQSLGEALKPDEILRTGMFGLALKKPPVSW